MKRIAFVFLGGVLFFTWSYAYAAQSLGNNSSWYLPRVVKVNVSGVSGVVSNIGPGIRPSSQNGVVSNIGPGIMPAPQSGVVSNIGPGIIPAPKN